MNERHICAGLRRELSKTGYALLIYYAIMNVSVSAVAAVDALVLITSEFLGGNMDILTNGKMDSLLNNVFSNGWGYILASLIGAVALLLWKKKQFCFVQIWKAEKPISAGSFLMLLCLFIGSQALFQLLSAVMEWFFNLFGLSVMDSLASASITGDMFSMFLYIAVIAPIAEEILFRGLILRTLQPYGKKFAIFASAFLFGIFHGNIVQTPFAFVVGLILGYTAVEYSIHWAIVLHMFNNLILGEVLTRITYLLPLWAGELIYFAIIWGCAVAAVAILIVKRRQIRDYLWIQKIHPLCLKSFFSSAGVLILTALMTFSMLAMLILPLWT